MTSVVALLVLTLSVERPLPEHCAVRAAEVQGAGERAWNEAYQAGFRAIQAGAYDEAEGAMCRALVAAREFDARDWRYAETLDELGLIAFELGDFELAERMQGAAIAEMLLAAGPTGEPLRGEGTSAQSPVREDCRSGIRVYIERLGWIHERTGPTIGTDTLRREPWRAISAGYLPLDPGLADRLDWLVSQYLLEENVAAAAALGELQRELRAD